MVVVEKVPLPEIDWPAFPEPVDVSRLPDGRIVMPVEYWLELTRYVIAMEAAADIVEAYRETE